MSALQDWLRPRFGYANAVRVQITIVVADVERIASQIRTAAPIVLSWALLARA